MFIDLGLVGDVHCTKAQKTFPLLVSIQLSRSYSWSAALLARLSELETFAYLSAFSSPGPLPGLLHCLQGRAS